MDFAEKMKQAAEEKKKANVGGTAISELQQKLQAHDEGVKIADQDKKRAEAGLAPKKTFNLAQKMAMLKAKDEEDGEKKVIDPYTVKVRKFPSDVTETDLYAIFEKYGAITRVKVPMD